MKKGDIVTVVAATGEYIGKLDVMEAGKVTLTDPRMLVHGQQGMGFAKGVCASGEEDPTQMTFNTYIFMVPTNKEVESGWRQYTSGIIT